MFCRHFNLTAQYQQCVELFNNLRDENTWNGSSLIIMPMPSESLRSCKRVECYQKKGKKKNNQNFLRIFNIVKSSIKLSSIHPPLCLIARNDGVTFFLCSNQLKSDVNCFDLGAKYPAKMWSINCWTTVHLPRSITIYRKIKLESIVVFRTFLASFKYRIIYENKRNG